jgi:hypothetical protein
MKHVDRRAVLRACTRLGPALLAAAVCVASQAQPAAGAGARAAPLPGPWDPSAAVPQARYRSVFTAPRPAGPVDAIDWRQANDAVRDIGGWRAYAREAAEPGPASPTGLAGGPGVPGTIPRHGAPSLPRLE